MSAVLAGFAALGAVVAVGWVAGRTGVLGADAAAVLSRLSFFVATPALLVLTLAAADPGVLLSSALVATGGSALLAALLYVGLAWWRWRPSAAQLTTGAFASSYVNAANLGVPITAYVLGDASYVAPVLLFQVLVMAPVGLAVLARSAAPAGGAPSRWRLWTQPVRTPVVIGCVLGLLLAATGLQLPELVRQPVSLLAALAVPAALLAFGMSLSGAARPATGEAGRHVWLAVALKTAVQPALAYALGRWAVQLSGVHLLAVTLTSALPTAQNVFVYATAYDRGIALARDAVLVSTVLSIPVLVVVAVVLA